MLWCCRPAAPKGKQKWAAAPEGAHRAPACRHPAGASPLCKRWAQAKHRQHPRLPGQAQDRTAATLSQIKFFHRMWTNLFAVAGSRGHPPAGVTHKRGLRPPLARPRRVGAPFLARRSTRNPLPARCGHIRCPLGTLPRCAPLRVWLPRITCSHGGVCPASTTHAKKPFACPASVTAHANPAQNARSAVRYWYSLSSGSISR